MHLSRPCMESIHMDPGRVILLLLTLYVSDNFVSANGGIVGSPVDSTDYPSHSEYGVSGYAKTLTCNPPVECDALGIQWTYKKTVEHGVEWLNDGCHGKTCVNNTNANSGIGTAHTSMLTIRNMSEYQTGIYKCVCLPSVNGIVIISIFDLRLCPLLKAELSQDGQTQTFNNTMANMHTVTVMKNENMYTSCPDNDTISSTCTANFRDDCTITCGNARGCNLSLTLNLQADATTGPSTATNGHETRTEESMTSVTHTSSLTESEDGTRITSAWYSTSATAGISQSTAANPTRSKPVVIVILLVALSISVVLLTLFLVVWKIAGQTRLTDVEAGRVDPTYSTSLYADEAGEPGQRCVIRGHSAHPEGSSIAERRETGDYDSMERNYQMRRINYSRTIQHATVGIRDDVKVDSMSSDHLYYSAVFPLEE